MRELKAISKHADGMSSDEEVPETDASAFRSQIGIDNFINSICYSKIVSNKLIALYNNFISFCIYLFRSY